MAANDKISFGTWIVLFNQAVSPFSNIRIEFNSFLRKFNFDIVGRATQKVDNVTILPIPKYFKPKDVNAFKMYFGTASTVSQDLELANGTKPFDFCSIRLGEDGSFTLYFTSNEPHWCHIIFEYNLQDGDIILDPLKPYV